MTILSRSRARFRAAGRDRGSMSIMMFVVIIGMSLGALMVPLVVTQSRTTTHTDSRIQSLHLAQSGINVMLGRLRYATDQGGVSGLPCAPLAWPTASAATGYSVSVRYYLSAPPAGTELICPLEVGGRPVVPRFAQISSTGTVQTGTNKSSRTLQTTYTFTTTDTGQIRFNPNEYLDVDETECLTATGDPPEAGMQLVVAACLQDPKDPKLNAQQFFYDSSLALVLAHSRTDAVPDGLCVSVSTTTDAVTLEACAKDNPNPDFNQQWSLNAVAAFAGTGANSAPVCLGVRPDGTDIVAAACQATYDSTASWLPTPSVGAGAAGALSSQLLNFSRFGSRVQAGSYSGAGPQSAVLYPCEQRSTPAAVSGFQKFDYDPATSRWSTTVGGATYCLTSHGVGALVTMDVCGPSDAQKWTDHGSAEADQAGAAQQWDDAVRYTIVSQVSGSPLCLSLAVTVAPYLDPVSKISYSRITTETCDTSARQKWNAGSPQPSTVTNTGEH